MIMDKKTKMSKISELMGHKDIAKKITKKDKDYKNKKVKSGYQGNVIYFHN